MLFKERGGIEVIADHSAAGPGEDQDGGIQQPGEAGHEFGDEGTAAEDDDDAEEQAKSEGKKCAVGGGSNGEYVIQAHRDVGNKNGQDGRSEAFLFWRRFFYRVDVRELLDFSSLLPTTLIQEPQGDPEQDTTAEGLNPGDGEDH